MRHASMLLIALTACSTSYADEPPSTRFEHDMMARFHMHESYSLFGAIEHLLVHGKLDEARDLARSIGIAPDEAGLSAWATQAAVVRDRATALANATSVADACRLAAKLAEACALCHVDTNAVPEFRAPPALPPDRPTVEVRMARHRWAVERIREGVIGAVNEPWQAGLDVLAQAPLPWPAEDAERAQLARRIHDVADRARKRGDTDTEANRATAYGELLVTCASCHAVADTQKHD
jgi:mono/diheme cytochrome c family protein